MFVYHDCLVHRDSSEEMPFLSTNPPNFCVSHSEPGLLKERLVNRHTPLVNCFQSFSEILWFRTTGKMVSAKNASTITKA